MIPAPGVGGSARPVRGSARRARGPAVLVLIGAAALPGAAPARAAAEEVAVLETPHGDIVWRFFKNDVPEHVAYVKALIRRGFYDGTTIHRAVPRFVIQGGDPNSRNADRADDGEGEADRRLAAEFSQRLHYRPGTVGMARDADPDSGSCQFFIALEDLPRLDGRYTIFGEVIAGLDVARRIADLPRDLNDNPIEPVPVRARLETRRVPKQVLSLAAAVGSGETLTGPVKPRPYDPGNLLWRAPRLRAAAGGAAPGNGGRGVAGAAPAQPAPRLELAVGADGHVLDVRFPAIAVADPAGLRARALGWSFEPAMYDGRPVKARFEIDADGANPGPPTGGGVPVEPGPEITPPRPQVRVELAPGRQPPERPVTLRLTIDESGAVQEAVLQATSGDALLDEAAVAAARALVFAPATRAAAGAPQPRPVPVYLTVEARFVPAPAAAAAK